MHKVAKMGFGAILA